jgi:acyl transferase domain-containing protein/pimeloyl-ACP methyl ester carboxylesterase/acyl carrier protein
VELPTYPWQRERYWIDLGQDGPDPDIVEPIADWFYQVDWPEVPHARAGVRHAESGRWLVLADRGGLGEAVAAALSSRGLSCTVLHAPARASLVAEHAATALDGGNSLQGVLYLWGLDAIVDAEASADEVGEIARRAVLPTLALLQALGLRGAGSPRESPRLWIATRGACAVGDESGVAPCQAALWGLGRVAALEHPAVWGGLVDLDPEGGSTEVELLVAEMLEPDVEDQLAFRKGRRHGARLTAAPPKGPVAPLTLSAEGSYLVTGGLGALGLLVARWLVEKGARHLVLSGRQGLPDRAAWGAAQPPEIRARISAVQALEALGARVTVAAVDVADANGMSALLTAVEPPLRGLVHTAGLGPVRVLAETDQPLLDSVLRPKVTGTWLLHRLLRDRPLDLFVLFSSGAAVWGGHGQGAYAAANAFLDGLAHQRRAQSLPALSVDWGVWAEGQLGDAQFLARMSEIGVLPMATAPALAALERLVGTHAVQCTVTRMDWARFAPVYAARGRRNLLAAVAKGSGNPASPPGVPASRSWDGVSIHEARTALRELVRQTIAGVLGFRNADSLDPRLGFAEQGLDSLMAVQIGTRLGRKLGVPLPATLAFDHPTVERLAAHLLIDVLRLEERAETAAARSATVDEGIAIVGAACRFPGGAENLDAYWKLLTEGGVAVSDVPASRWRAADWYDPDPAPNRTYVSKGSFLKGDLQTFDPRFFRISPREAVSLDPQQRLLLEVSWEALEDSGQVLPALRESPTGVFVGVGPNEYAERLKDLADDAGGLYVGTGNMLSVTAGRLSFFLGLHGPSLAVDTACSSSLVALHLGCQSLRLGECDRALIGGVNVLLSPASFVMLSRMRALAPDGRCKTFSAAADGYGRAEGCAVVVLKRLRDAERDGDRILGVIRGTAVNHDGASSGLTVPNGPAQQALLREAMAEAGVAAADIDFVECHGTGTALGDPIEVQALSAVYGHARPPERPLILGSAKANLGHLEPAAGMAGLIKVLLALHHEQIPAQPELGELNPHVPWNTLPVAVAREATPWPRAARPRRAGVSAFGLSGTNAHVIVEEAPAAKVEPAAPERPAELFVLSANSAAALDAQAARLGDHMAIHAEQALCDIAFSLATTRSPMDHRLAVVTSSQEGLRTALELASRGQTPPGAVRGTTASSLGGLAFLFAGQGAQVLGMGRGLCAAWPAFREPFDRCVALFDRELVDRPLREVMWAEPGSEEATLLDETAFTQPALFALEYALAALWRSWGVEPNLVLGHSIGELVAACVAGVFSLEDAVRLVAARARCMQALPTGGAMVAISAPVAEVTAAVAPYAASVSVAAVNGPESVVIAGAEEAVLALGATFAACGVRTKRLSVSHAFHSPLMDSLPEAFRRVASTVTYRAPDRPLVSNVTGAVAGTEIATPEYWIRQLRYPVRFSDGIHALRAAGTATFVEIGPKSTLLGLVPACVGQANVALVPSLRADRSEPQAVFAALASWYAVGGRIDWKGVFAERAHRVDLPTYAWQRERHWIDVPARRPTTASDAGRWPLAGVAIPMPGSVLHHVVSVGSRHQVFLGDHLVFGRIVVAGAFHVSVILAVAAERWPDRAIELTGVEFVRAIALEVGQEVDLHAVLSPEGDEGCYRFELATDVEGKGWTTHARGRLQTTDAAPRALLEAEMLEDRATEPVNFAAAVFDRLSAMQIEWGPLWRWLRDGRVGAGLSLSTLAPTYPRANDLAPVHPCLLDNGFATVLLGGGLSDPEDATPRVPFGVDRLRWWRAPEGSVRCRTATRPNTHGMTDFVLVDESGGMVAEVEGFTTRRAKFDSFLPQELGALTGCLYRLEWPDAAGAGGTRPEPGWVVVAAPGSEMAAALAARLERCALTEPSGLQATLSQTATDAGVICLWEARSEEGAAEAAIRVATEGLQVVLALEGRTSGRLLWVTTSAVPVRPGDAVAAATAPMWGLGRTVMQERPELGCTLVDLEPGAVALDTLMRELSTNDGESQVAWRTGSRHAARLVRAPAIAGDRPLPLSIQGTVLLSGGLGALGLQVARWLAQQRVPHLVLTGRRGANTPGAAEAVAELEALGTRVTVAAVDVADREALKAVLDAIPGDLPLRGVVHAAGVLDDGVLAEQNAKRFAGVLSPKVKGAWNLHALTAGSDLAFFVMFSSLSGLLGGAGQSNYAAANSFLDALAAHRRAEGLAAQSLAWGPWSEGGMAARLGAAQQARLARQGFGALSPTQGIALFAQAMARPEAVLGLVSLDLRAVSRAFGVVVPSMWRALVRGSSARPHAAPEAEGVWARRLSTLPPAGRADEVRDAVLTDLANVLSVGDGNAIPVDQPLSDLGLDSLMAVELRAALSLRVGSTLPATLAFDHPTVDALSHWLLADVLAVTELAAPAANASVAEDLCESVAGTAPMHVHSSLSAFEETHILEDGRGARCCLRWAKLEERRGPPLLLLHGVGANHHYFGALSERLGRHDLLVPSLPGRCGSDGPPLTTVSEAAQWILDLLADLNVPEVVVVGHSYGGAIAMELAMLQGELPAARRPVAGLVLVGTPRLPLDPQVTDLFASPGDSATVTDRALSFLVSSSAPRASESILRHLAAALRLTPMAASASDFAAVKDLARGDPAPEGIHLPTLVLVGSEDRVAPPRYARYLARHISKSRLVVLDDVGHHPPVEATQQVAEQILSFLDDLELSHGWTEAKYSYVRELSLRKATSR